MKNKIFAVAALSVSILFFSPPLNALAAGKVGYIDLQRILHESAPGKKAGAEIKKFKELKNKEVQVKQTEIQDIGEKVREERGKKEINPNKIKELVEKSQLKEKELKRFLEDVNEELKKKENDLFTEILNKAAPLLKKIAKEKGFTLVLKNGADLAYLDPEVDITEDVIKEMNHSQQ